MISSFNRARDRIGEYWPIVVAVRIELNEGQYFPVWSRLQSKCIGHRSFERLDTSWLRECSQSSSFNGNLSSCKTKFCCYKCTVVNYASKIPPNFIPVGRWIRYVLLISVVQK